jgi:DNA polymerase-3 subunit delta'
VSSLQTALLPLPGHAEVLAHVVELAATDQLPNSIALTCAPGWGETRLLEAVCRALLNLNPATDIEDLAHPDFRWITPEGAMIKIDQVRNLADFAVGTAQIAPRKVGAIQSAHLLNTNAANALLKTLEEPPPNTHIILSTSSWGKLLPTVRSRCQRIELEQSTVQALAWLDAAGIKLTVEEFAEFGYAPLTALAGHAATVRQWLSGLNPQRFAEHVDEVLSLDASDWLARWYRCIGQHLQGQSLAALTVPPRRLHAFADELISVRRQLDTSNSTNARLQVERLLADWFQLTKTT